jgi:hypothetical protein
LDARKAAAEAALAQSHQRTHALERESADNLGISPMSPPALASRAETRTMTSASDSESNGVMYLLPAREAVTVPGWADSEPGSARVTASQGTSESRCRDAGDSARPAAAAPGWADSEPGSARVTASQGTSESRRRDAAGDSARPAAAARTRRTSSTMTTVLIYY